VGQRTAAAVVGEERDEPVGRNPADGELGVLRQLDAGHRLQDRGKLRHGPVEDLPAVERFDEVDVRGLDVEDADLPA
jgi:hypothetical protein